MNMAEAFTLPAMNDYVYLVRHCEVNNPEGIVYADLDGYGLTELGRAQAADAATRLPQQPTIVSSPLERAVETAGIIAAAVSASVVIDDELTEWYLGRRWAGHVWVSLDDDFPGELTAYLDHPDRLPFSDESLAALADRVVGRVRRHRAAVVGPLVIVSHQDPIQAGRLALTGRPLGELHRDKPGHGAVITFEEAGSVWLEQGMWAPPQGALFPPIDS